MGRFVSVNQLSKRLSLTPRRCQQLIQARIFIKKERGQYDLTACAISYAVFLRRYSGSEVGLPCTIKDLEMVFQISGARITALVKAGVLPKNSHGRFDLVACVQAYVEHIKNNGQLPLLGMSSIRAGAGTS